MTLLVFLMRYNVIVILCVALAEDPRYHPGASGTSCHFACIQGKVIDVRENVLETEHL